MKKISFLLDQFSERTGRIFSWLTLVMVLLMALIVTLRYVFQIGSIALQESIIYINALIFTLGAAYTLKENGHVRVDIFYSRLTPRSKAIIDLIGTLVFLLPSAIFICWVSWDYVSLSWRIKEASAELSGLPYVYLLKATIILLAALLSLQGISEVIKSITIIRESNT
ncbi:MAG: C4-dicarboxylate ABC transporter permease [SAR86 cluster bacterium]|uniref:TRAP transporter small permease protein n=1 Tax=SAR86 cluster bacterium TaxID=2030880 RepID=A0A2A5AT62_9GAMM|nr:MAG: C4-dicarboxylate ABC transporter permease [SAR86 cluster bacterium]